MTMRVEDHAKRHCHSYLYAPDLCSTGTSARLFSGGSMKRTYSIILLICACTLMIVIPVDPSYGGAKIEIGSNSLCLKWQDQEKYLSAFNSQTGQSGAASNVGRDESGIPAQKTEIPPPADQLKIDTVKVFSDENKAIQSPGSGLFNTGGFPLEHYMSDIFKRIKEKWYIPSNLKNLQAQTTVIFHINKSGQVKNAQILAGSGNNGLDIAALFAILSSSPFPALPEGFPADYIGVKIVFRYIQNP
jgi:TonB family protein